MIRWLRAKAACLALGLWLVPAVASAQRIVLLRPKTADPVLLQAFGRLQGELAVHDFEVIVVDAEDDLASPSALAKAAEKVGAVATVSLLRSEGLASADVWISDRVTGKTSMRTIATARPLEAASVLAIRAVDLLRTSLREFAPGERPPADVVGASPERAPAHVHAWANPEPTRPRWSVETSFVAQSTLSDLGTAYAPAIALGMNLSAPLAVRLGFQGPFSGAHVAARGASVTLRQEQLFGELAYRLVAREAWSLEASGALGAHRLDVQGSSTTLYVGRSDSAWTGLAAAGLELEFAVSRGAALVAASRAVYLAPRPVVRLADSEHPYGRPSVQGCAGLRVLF